VASPGQHQHSEFTEALYCLEQCL